MRCVLPELASVNGVSSGMGRAIPSERPFEREWQEHFAWQREA